MSNKVLALPFIAGLTFFILLFLFTKIFGPIPFFVSSVTTQKTTTFDVTGQGKVTVKPDIASVSVGIQASGQSVKGVQDQINTIINKVSASIKSLGVDSKDIQTTNYSVNPEYDPSAGLTGSLQAGSGQAKIKGYTATTNLQIKVREIDKVNQIIDLATQNGANQVGGISFDLDDKTKVENEARQLAVEDAKKKASDAAKIAGFKLGKIVNYSENLGGFPRPMIMTKNLQVAGGGSTDTQVESGSSDITVSVTLSYDIL